jgi:hypothetical protein
MESPGKLGVKALREKLAKFVLGSERIQNPPRQRCQNVIARGVVEKSQPQPTNV